MSSDQSVLYAGRLPVERQQGSLTMSLSGMNLDYLDSILEGVTKGS